MNARVDISGERFGRLIAESRQDDGKWTCACDCGGKTQQRAAYLRSGNTTSCGCISREKIVARNTTHGLTSHPLYPRWAGMLARCSNPAHIGYESYGGRGITVCERWTDFAAFLEDMGELPFEGATIERDDRNGDYTPENCRWASSAEQSRNTGRNVVIDLEGHPYILKDLERKLGFKRGTLNRRLGLGWSVYDAINSPVQPGKALRRRS